MRPPDLIIDGGNGPQTLRWHLFQRWGVQVALHCWLQSDHDRALHDHSADNISILLSGPYWEVFSHRWEPMRKKLRLPLIPYFRRAEVPHRVKLMGKRYVWTLWIRFAPRREWGFHCPQGWKHWKDYLSTRDYSAPGSTSGIGNGC